MKTLKPMGDRVLVKVTEGSKQTSGGIFLPDSSVEEKSEGVVISVGKGRMYQDRKIRTFEFEIGDTVVFGKFSGEEVVINDEKHRLLREDDILARYV